MKNKVNARRCDLRSGAGENNRADAMHSSSNNSEALPPLRRVRELLQLGLSQPAISNNDSEVIADLAYDIDGEEKFSRAATSSMTVARHAAV
jgi:hypothetical protein